MAKWTVEDIPQLSGKIAVVTGANSGLGLETALALAGKGAHVVMACRSPEKAGTARDQILASHPSASLELGALDLASLASVKRFAAWLKERHPRIDLLINNAGIMAIPYRKTEDGFEMQMGTNHFGHFALTGLVWDQLEAAKNARIVNVSSQAHLMGKMRFDDLAWEKNYSKWPAYGMSKLANLLFTYELARKIKAKNKAVLSVAAHPGYAATNLQLVGPQMSGSTLMAKMTAFGNPIMAQSAAMGALPQLYAATAGDVEQGDYIGPDGLFNARGYPKKTKSNARSHDEESAKKLWEKSEELTGVRFERL